MGEAINRIFHWSREPKNGTILLFCLWIVGIVFIWTPNLQTFLSDLNFRANPNTFLPNDILTIFLTLLAFLPAITLTAATIASNTYSYKVLDFFKNDFYFWTLIITYLSMIMLSFLFILYSVTSPKLLLSLQLSAFLLLAFIIPYFLATYRNISFEDIVKKFARLVNRKKYLKILFSSSESFIPSKDDPSLYLRDLLLKSIKNSDFAGFSVV